MYWKNTSSLFTKETDDDRESNRGAESSLISQLANIAGSRSWRAQVTRVDVYARSIGRAHRTTLVTRYRKIDRKLTDASGGDVGGGGGGGVVVGGGSAGGGG